MVNTRLEPKTKWVLLAAFLIPVLILTGICISRGIYPFGDQMFLRSDMYHQYAPFMKEFQRNLQTGGSLLYTWNIGLGNNFASTYAYYLASPFNWLVGLFPADLLPEFMLILIILRTGLMSASFSWYLKHRFQRNSWLLSIWGCFYAMSAYMAAYNYNIMWLDCLILFPLILAGLEDLVKKGSFRLYTITLALSCFTNYYISIMICFFLVFYFCYLLLCEESPLTKKETGNRILRFCGFSLLGGAMAMFVILPALYNLFLTASYGSGFPSTMEAYFNLLQIITQSVINTEVSMFDTHLPNIYCTMLVFLLVPLYLAARGIPLKERIGKGALLLLLIFSFMFTVPTYIWHGFHFPNSLPCRYSFLYIILILIMGYQAFLHIRDFRATRIAAIAAIGIAMLFALQAVFSDDSPTVENISLGAFFIALYAGLLLLIQYKDLKPVILLLFMLLAIGEITINTFNTGYSTTSRTGYIEKNESIRTLLEQTDSNGFYRIENLSAKTKNDGAWNGYRSASVFSSTITAGNSGLYADLGLLGKTNSYGYAGHTPVTQALLGVRYELTDTPADDPLKTELASAEDCYLYENLYTLSLGFMVRSSVQTPIPEEVDPFFRQNMLIQNACGVEEVFHLQKPEYGKTVQFTASAAGRFLIYVPSESRSYSPMESCSISILRGNEIIRQKTFDHLDVSWILDLGDVQENDLIIINNKDKDALSVSVFPAIMDYEKYKKAVEILSLSPLEITTFSDTRISGHIMVSSGQILFTTIPYDPGWKLYVDGVETSYNSFEDSFIICKLPEGEHALEFRYTPQGLFPGVIISAAALACFLVLLVFRKKICKYL